MQAIVTKYIGPTNYRGSRVKASCQAGTITLPWSYELGVNENHDKAAMALAFKLGWDEARYGKLVGGGMPDGTGNAYVFCQRPKLESTIGGGK